MVMVVTLRADQIKTNNNANLELGTSWIGGTAPGGGDNAIWDATVATPANCINTLASAAVWKGIVVSNPAAAVAINGNTTLTLSNGINLTSASVNLTVNCGTINLGANQTWSVATGRTLTTGSATTSGAVNSPNNGNFVVTKTGGGVWITSGTGDNGSTGLTVNGGTVNLNKSSGSAHSIGGPGLALNNGGTARITGTGGDQIYDAATVSLAAGGTFDLNGNTETIARLTGSGGTVDNTAPGATATLTLGNGTATFSGSIRNTGSGSRLALVKTSGGAATLGGANTYTGGTSISAGTLALTTTNNLTMPYTNTGGVLSLTAVNSTNSLPMTLFNLGSGSPQLSFNLNGLRNLTSPLITNSGNLILNGNVAVNVTNVVQSGAYVLLRYTGTRSGAGNFVAGSLPSGASLTDDTANKKLLLTYASPLQPRVIIPTLNTQEIVVAVATPQQYGAVGDGLTDDAAAFQKAMNAVYNSGGSGGGVVFVPAGHYAFYTNLTIPTGVTLHGDWQDWTRRGGGLVGTTFKVYFGAGQATNPPFIALKGSTALRGVNIWYPDQNPASIVSYPFTIGLDNDCVVQNVVLVNSYQGIETYTGGSKHILRTVIGSPLFKGIELDQIFDVCHAEDIRFSPEVWPASGLTNAPAAGGPHAAWMRANGEAMRLLRVDGEMCMDTFISGYNVGIETVSATNGEPGAAFYSGCVSNCATALLAQNMPSAFGLMFAGFTLDGDIAIKRTSTTTEANALFDRCQIIGRNGPAVSVTGNSWHSWMQFQDCTISNALQLAGPGVFNVVNSTLLGSTQCVMSAAATRAAFTGCTFSPTPKIVNSGNAGNLLVDARHSVSNALPLVFWTNVAQDALSRKAARTNLYVATDIAWGAYGDGVADDTDPIQNALTAAGAAGGGLVYLPAGKYRLTSTLTIPSGVELRGAYELRHRTWPGADNHAKGTVLEPYGGQGATTGPVALALQANSGLVGVTLSYETQNSNCLVFPPAIQGQGGNIYVMGVCCPNPYYYVDLDTYPCTNHFLDMVDGWALKTGYKVGHGSSGTIVDCHGNWTYWIDNYDSASGMPGNSQPPVLDFVSHNLEMYVMGDCTELMVKDFSIIEKTYLNCIAQAGRGPNLTLINNYCDASIQGFVLDAAAPCTITAVNTPMTPFNFGGYGDQAQSTVGVLSTTNFQGTARFLNSAYWGGSYLDFNLSGGDVGFDLAHMDHNSTLGSIVNGGVFHLVNASANANGNPAYKVSFGPNAGVAGQTAEFIGCYAYNGCSLINAGASNALNCWADYALAAYSILDPGLPVIYGVAPDGAAPFQSTNVFTFSAAAPAGLAPSNIVVTLDGARLTNLVYAGAATAWNVSYPGLTLNKAHTAVITLKDNSGRTTTNVVSFDTFAANVYTFEAEDFDYNRGLFIDNPQTNAFAGLAAVDGIDCHNASGGNSSYRPNPSGLATETASDALRAAYATGPTDYDVGWNNGGNWGNYTRTYPAGVYNLYMRAASPNGSPITTDAASLALVTAGWGTSNQTMKRLGTFDVPNTGDWHKFTWVALKDASGNLVQLTNTGSIKTLRATTDNGGYNVNFYALAPTTANLPILSLLATPGSLALSLPTQPGFSYEVLYKSNLTDTVWIPLGPALVGNGAIQSITLPTPDRTRFYRVQVY